MLQAGFPSLNDCEHEAEKLRTLVNCFECVKYYLLSNTPGLGLDLGLKYVKGKLKLNIDTVELQWLEHI